MRLSRQAAFWSSCLSLPTIVSALTINCDHIRVDKVDFNLSKLKGPHTVTHLDKDVAPGSITNTTFTLDICAPLTKKKNDKASCETGTRICAAEYLQPEDGKGETTLTGAWPVAGDFTSSNGRKLEPNWERLKDSKSNADKDLEGLRLEMNGGQHAYTTKKAPNKAYIELICDHDKTGLEGEDDSGKRRKREEGDDDGDGDKGKEGDEEDDQNKGKSLKFLRFKEEKDGVEILRLKWYTKYACEDQQGKDSDDNNGKGSWGFFTWFIIILFLAIAAYLIFGSWLNYNRYGARGWDLLPHGDTIRDLPYLLKDWGRRVVSTIQGGGSRGGYSAV